MIASIWKNRKLAYKLAGNDIRTRFAGSYLGVVWAFIQPIVTVLVYWFVFQVGFRSPNNGQYPFVLFLVSGIIPWFFFTEALSGGTNVLFEYSYLVKKVVFNIDILPLVKIVSALFVHAFFIVIALIILMFYGFMPSLYTLQLFYYIACTILLVMGIIFITASIMVFFRDIYQFVNIFVIQLGVWLTPIMWDADQTLVNSPKLHTLFKLNPMYYIVDGFRDSLLYHRWVWEKGLWTLYFWCVTLVILLFGMGLYKKLKVHFADVL